MDPTVWGPKLWFIMHTYALNYSDNPSRHEKHDMAEFFNNLKTTIPCNRCRLNYNRHLETNPVENHLTDKHTLFKWTVDIHNETNKSIGKPIYSYEEAERYYNDQYNRNISHKSSGRGMGYPIVCIILCIIIAALIIKYEVNIKKLYQ